MRVGNFLLFRAEISVQSIRPCKNCTSREGSGIKQPQDHPASQPVYRPSSYLSPKSSSFLRLLHRSRPFSHTFSAATLTIAKGIFSIGFCSGYARRSGS